MGRLPDRVPRHAPVSRLTGVTRDLALVMPDGLPYETVRSALLEIPAPAPVSIDAVDRYEGPPLEPGESSLTVRVTLKPSERTLTDAEIEGYRQALVSAVEKRCGLKIRS